MSSAKWCFRLLALFLSLFLVDTQTLEAEQAAAMDKSRQLPEFGPGDIIEIKMVSIRALSMVCLQIKCKLTA